MPLLATSSVSNASAGYYAMLDSPDGRWLSFWPLVYADEHPTFCAFVLPRKLVIEAALEDVSPAVSRL